jgi:hypothetical protein
MTLMIVMLVLDDMSNKLLTVETVMIGAPLTRTHMEESFQNWVLDSYIVGRGLDEGHGHDTTAVLLNC